MRDDFYSEHTVRGRRVYKCAFCRVPIEKGALHVTVSSCSCGEISSWRAHVACHEHVSGQPAPAPTAARESKPAEASA